MKRCERGRGFFFAGADGSVWRRRSNTYESPTRLLMWSKSNRTTSRATSEAAAEAETEATMVDAAETGAEGVGAVVVVAVEEEVLERSGCWGVKDMLG